MCPGIGLEGWFRWFACPLGAVVCKSSCVVVPCFIPDPCYFAPCSSKVAVGFLVSLQFFFYFIFFIFFYIFLNFLLLLFIFTLQYCIGFAIQNFPQLHMCAVIFNVIMVSLYFYHSHKSLPRCKHCSIATKGPTY